MTPIPDYPMYSSFLKVKQNIYLSLLYSFFPSMINPLNPIISISMIPSFLKVNCRCNVVDEWSVLLLRCLEKAAAAVVWSDFCCEPLSWSVAWPFLPLFTYWDAWWWHAAFGCGILFGCCLLILCWSIGWPAPPRPTLEMPGRCCYCCWLEMSLWTIVVGV